MLDWTATKVNISSRSGIVGIPGAAAYAALFLASDEAKYITGIELTVHGGIVAGSSASPKREE